MPLDGSPKQTISEGPEIRQVALVGYDYPGLKPTMAVQEGDSVKAGQLLFTDKKTEGVGYTSPGSGRVLAINRGDKRVFESIVIELESDEGDEGDAAETWPDHDAAEIRNLDRSRVVETLVASGHWTAIRTRPYSKVPAPDAAPPEAFFITASDTRPHCPDPTLFIREESTAWLAGIDALSRLTEGPVHVCASEGSELPLSDNPRVQHETFAGPHPSGNVGTHIHFLHPVHANRSVWHVGYQDVIAIGHLFLTGRLFLDRVIALAGPEVKSPRLLRTRLGAGTDALVAGEVSDGRNRIISGSVLDGRRAANGTAWLGRFHNQVSVLHEGTERELLEFIMPGFNKFSLTRLFLGAFRRGNFRMSTSTEGSARSILALGTFEKVMPLDILPTQLLRALVVGDFDASIELGALELDEEDLALCTFACPGKYEYGPWLRQMLTRIEQEA